MKKINMRAVSMSCGILPHTLRVWEQRYAVFNPERSQGGQRLYSEEDLKKALILKKLIDQGYTISHIAKFNLNELQKMVNTFKHKKSETKDSNQKIINYIELFEIEKIREEIAYIRLNTNIKEFVFDFALPLLRLVGKMVANEKLTVTQEHIISNLISDEIKKVEIQGKKDSRAVMALATPDGNLHELSLLIANLLCYTNRHETHYLGASHPPASLANALNTIRPTCLVLGVVSSDFWNYEKKIVHFLNNLEKFLTFELEVVLGGGFKMNFPKYKNIKKLLIIETLEDFDKFLVQY